MSVGAAEQVERDRCLLDQAIPEMERKLRIGAVETRNEASEA